MKLFQKHEVTIAILCGGRSARLGTDKGLYSPLGDEPLVARAVRLFSPFAREVLIVVRDDVQAATYLASLKQNLAGFELQCVRVVTDSMDQSAAPQAALSGITRA